jgi:hypothetical protein
MSAAELGTIAGIDQIVLEPTGWGPEARFAVVLRAGSRRSYQEAEDGVRVPALSLRVTSSLVG